MQALPIVGEIRVGTAATRSNRVGAIERVVVSKSHRVIPRVATDQTFVTGRLVSGSMQRRNLRLIAWLSTPGPLFQIRAIQTIT